MLFHRWRIRRLSTKMNCCVKIISDIDEWLESSDDAVLDEIETLRYSRLKAKAELERLTWKYIELKQKHPHKTPPFPTDGTQWDSFNSVKKQLESQRLQTTKEPLQVEKETFGELIDKIGPIAIREEQGVIPLAGLSEASMKVLERVNREKSDDESLMDRLLGEPITEVTPELIDRIRDGFDSFDNITEKTANSFSGKLGGCCSGPPPSPYTDNPTINVSKEKAEDILRVTLKDLEAPMRDKIVEEEPGLQGDLAMLLHKLRDPANHPVSLLDLAYKVANGVFQEPEAKLVASALDMLVDEYREQIGPIRNFEMSDKACLEALDADRNTTC